MTVGTSAAAKPAALGWWRTLSTGVLVAAATISVVTLLSTAGTDSLGWDFRYVYIRAAELVMDGGSPYPELDDELASGTAYVYPPQLAVALAPVSALPEDIVVWVAFAGAVTSLMGALALLGVRDLRCYAAVLAWGSTSNALEMTNISAFLALAVACMWRYRATIWPLATTLGLAIAMKLFLWPLAVWALATRRNHALVRAIGLGVSVVFISWAVIGFEDLTRYPDLLKRFSEVQEANSYSVVAAVVAHGGSSLMGQIVTVLVGGPLLVASVYFGRRVLDDERSFIAAVGATLLLTPVAWQHYYVLLAVPLAIARPRLSLLWLLPIVLWVCPRDGNGAGLQPFVPTLVVVALIAALLVRPRSVAVAATE